MTTKEKKATVIQYKPTVTKDDRLMAYAAALQVAAQRQVSHLVAFRSDYDKTRTKAMIALGLTPEAAASLLDMSPADLLGQTRTGWYVDVDLDGTLRNTEITKLPVHWARDFQVSGLIYPHYYVVLGDAPDTDDYHYRHDVFRTMQDAANAHARNLVVSIEE
jgi:hypothetical protein